MTQDRIARIRPLVEELGPFWIGHQVADGGVAANAMLVRVRGLWPDVSEVAISGDPNGEEDPEALALRIVHDVGETANRLLRLSPEEALGWSRANLIVDLERYLESVSGA